MRAIVRLYRGQNNYDFVRIWRWTLRVSMVLVVLSVVLLGARRLNLGIDFEGGVSWQVKAPGVTVEQTREALAPLGLQEAKVQTIGRDVMRVQAPAETADRKNDVRRVVAQLAGQPETAVTESDVGPTWGGEVTTAALRALIIFLFAIVAYVTMTFRGEWKLAIGVLVAVIHDVIISIGVYAAFQFEVTPATVIAFLTILGYSIYDTVVVYDKVQENVHRVGVGHRLSYTGMMNMSMNQVLMRSINTSVVGVLPVLSTLVVGALLLGAVTLEEFAIALTVGFVVGAYSSIFVAAPVVVLLKEREPRYRQLRERLEKSAPATAAAPAPAAPSPSVAGEPVGSEGDSAVPVGAGAPVTGESPDAPGANAFSRNHPPRPRKKGKRR
jgi:preprotein translocase subunit SecF